jgi:hypothetical protein
MDIINEKILIELYSKYINDSQYVFYREYDIIIIMKKINDLKCLSEIEPKKYYSSLLKVILMFDITDPYKLISNITKYNINKFVDSYCYDSIQYAYTLCQAYFESGQKSVKLNYFNGHYNGLYHTYDEVTGDIYFEFNYIDGQPEFLIKN